MTKKIMKRPVKEIWFRRKIYGWGWYPCTIEGWLITLAFVMAISLVAFIFMKVYHGETIILVAYLITIFLLGAVLVLIAWLKGESPRWSWGRK
jgi:hypothetical protein